MNLWRLEKSRSVRQDGPALPPQPTARRQSRLGVASEERVVHLPPGCINSLKRSTSVNVAVTARGRRCVVGGRVAATDSICTCVINLCVIMTHKPGYGAR
uniref:Uncharacterized protein n=1 Tax=Vitrella brassicaformis TaxID=1169539 RepID=A0A7S1P8E9_9ALVE